MSLSQQKRFENMMKDLFIIFCFLFQVYFNEMAKLNLLNDEELGMIFGSIECLLPLHEGTLWHYIVWHYANANFLKFTCLI